MRTKRRGTKGENQENKEDFSHLVCRQFLEAAARREEGGVVGSVDGGSKEGGGRSGWIRRWRQPARRCQLPVIFLFAIVLLASFVCSEAVDPNSEEGNCQYNLIGIATLSCQHHKDPSESPSDPCCTSLIHAVDEIPPVGESGECCLCRYTKDRLRTLALATSYISCYGKGRANVAKWTYPIKSCDEACNKTNILPGVSTPVKKNPQGGHGSRNTKIISVAVLFLLILLVGGVCYCWARQKHEPLQAERRFSNSSPRQTKGGRRRRSLPIV